MLRHAPERRYDLLPGEGHEVVVKIVRYPRVKVHPLTVVNDSLVLPCTSKYL